MLKFFNRLERTRNFVLLIFGLLMVASLIFFYAPTRGDLGANLARSEETAAVVGGEKITVGEVYRQKEAVSQMFQGRPFPASRILETLIQSRILRVEAARLGLTASDAEVAQAIRQQFTPTDGSAFDQQRYEEYATQQAGSVAAFEADLRDRISAEKLQAYVTAGVFVSEEEVLEDFRKRNTKFDLAYVVISPSEIAKNITPTEEQLRDYFEKNKQAYYISSPQKKIKYIYVNTAKIGEKLQISEEDLRAEYDKLPADKKIAGVNGRELVLRIPKPDMEATVMEKANQIVADLRKNGTTVNEQAFIDAAKGQSENPATAPLGGQLPGVVRDNPNNPTDPYQRLLKMQQGEISEPIVYKGRIFILWRGEAVPKSFENAKKEIEVSLRNRRAYAQAAEIAQKIDDALKSNKDVEAVARQFAAEANSTPEEMIRETDYVKPGDDVPNIGVSPQFEDGIAMLVNKGDVGEKIPIVGGFAIPMLVDKKEPRDATFEEVRNKLVDVVKLELAKGKVKEIADEITSAATSADSLAAAVSAKGLKLEEAKSFTLGTPLGSGNDATTSSALNDAIYALKQGEVTKTPVQIGDAYYVVAAKSRSEASMEEYAKQRSELMESMLAERRNAVFMDYLSAARQRLEAAGEIKIYKDAIAKLDEKDLPFGDLLGQ
jgi:peptidyl-prolyl cis-trans isomerase D